jgi:hypothetical protein
MTPHHLYEWAHHIIDNLDFDCLTETEYKKEERLLSSGTQELHALMPVNEGVLNTKINYSSPNFSENSVISVLKDMI